MSSPLNPKGIATEIGNFLDGLADLYPTSRITFSEMLPRVHNKARGDVLRHCLGNITEINDRVKDICFASGCGFIDHEDFRVDWHRGDFAQYLLCWDGCHLSRHGVIAIEKALRAHVMIYHDPLVTRSSVFVPIV